MKRRLLVIGVIAAVASATAVASADFVRTPPGAPVGQQVFYGHVKSLAKRGSRWELRFDPAWFLSGLTASRAKLEDTGDGDVPNDNYVRDDDHKLLTFIVPPSARVTVLVNEGTKGISSVPISVSELVQIVKGVPTKHKLFEPLDSGVWIRVRIDTLQELDQQYVP